ncbi:MAG: YheT family hydrolase [Acidobacteriota bacterium]
MQPFVPLVRNPHLLTVLAHFWPAGLDERRFPVERRLVASEPGVKVLVESQRPEGRAAGEIVMVHGLEGSSRAGYMLTLARRALEAGYGAHRLNLRTCGGTEAYSATPYHSGVTADLLALVKQLAREGRGPVYVAGFSLGGNVALKLAGELGEAARGLAAGFCAISTPIDLSACTRSIEKPENRLYEMRFVKRLKRRVRALAHLHPGRFSIDGLDAVRSIRAFDDRFTARWFGFRDAEDYYVTQSSLRVLEAIRVPVLMIQAKDDPVIPFGIFSRPEVARNPAIELVAPEHGGHIGFLARHAPRLWADEAILEWITSRA